ncbi:MAG: glycosyltransferase family 2 protein [Proteobacteria bacterium]|nr:glycosyltransferase family 2 protein [Pseudomonadota bacterium]
MDKPCTPTLPLLFQQPDGAIWPNRTEAGEAVSILMRTKDRPVLLPRALRSVAGQSFADWRLYLVNDGGDPGTTEALLAAEAAVIGTRLTVRHHSVCLGMEAASNQAIEMARGEFVVVHDDDDTWHPDFLARTVAFLRDPSNARFIGVVTDSRVVWERIDGGAVIEESREPLPDFRPNIELSRVFAGNNFPPISLMMRLAAVLHIGAFNADMPVLGDWEFNLRALAFGDLGVIEEPLAFYHLRRGLADPVYGNSVIAGTREHQRYDVLLRNSVIRLALRNNPALIGVLQPLLHAADETNETVFSLHRAADDQFDLLRRTLDRRFADLHARIDEINDAVAEIRAVSAAQGRMLAPLRQLWQRLLPLRRAMGGGKAV